MRPRQQSIERSAKKRALEVDSQTLHVAKRKALEQKRKLRKLRKELQLLQ